MFSNGIFQWRSGGKKKVSIAVAGDVCPYGNAADDILEGRSGEILRGIQPALDRADIRIVQWETVISDKKAPIVKAGPNLLVAPGCEQFMKAGKFDVALLANNHVGDHSPEGAVETKRIIEAAGIKTVGAGKDAADAAPPLHLEKNGLKISIINVCETEFGTSYDDVAGTNAMEEMTNILQIADERKSNDIVVIIIHGGNEYNPIPSPRMRKLYSAFARAGASAVVNIHTHCPQGVELVDNVPVIYAPGNFFFPELVKFDAHNFWWSGYLQRLTFDENGAFELEITPFEFLPEPWRIQPLEGAQRQWFLDYIEKISKLLLTEGEHWYDIWCAFKYTMPLYWLKGAPAEALAKDVADPDALKAFPGIRHMLTCQSHNDLARRSFLLIERGKMAELIKEIPKLNELRTARFCEM